MTDAEKGWLAGIIDGEGCIYAAHTQRLKSKRNNPSHQFITGLRIGMRSRKTIMHIRKITGVGYVKIRTPHGILYYEYMLWSQQAATLLRSLLPHLVNKKAQAKYYLALSRLLALHTIDKRNGRWTTPQKAKLVVKMSLLKRAHI